MSENTQDTMNDKAIEALEDAKNVQMNEQIEKQNEEINKQYEELETHTSKQYDASNIRVLEVRSCKGKTGNVYRFNISKRFASLYLRNRR